MKFNVGDTAYFPRVRLGLAQNDLSSFYRGTVVDVGHSKIKLDLPGGVASDWVATSFAKSFIRTAVITFGDFDSEFYVFNPLAKNITHHLRLMLGPDEVVAVQVRSINELKKFWLKEQASISHVVFIGHGNGTSVFFAIDEWVSGNDLSQALRVHGAPKKHFLSLCCKSGLAAFAKSFSSAAICEDLVAPYHSVHAAVASQFFSTYFLSQYLGGATSKIAFNKAEAAVVEGTKFRFWDNGHLKQS